MSALLAYPTLASVRAWSVDEFVAAAGSDVGRKVNTRAWLEEG